jgi:hypothetical protein
MVSIFLYIMIDPMIMVIKKPSTLNPQPSTNPKNLNP